MKRADKERAATVLRGMLEVSKLSTIRSIYERIAPGEDGRIRSNMSPVGTETGRFSHSETFLEVSTNLGNLPKKQALYDPLFEVRACITPSPGKALGEADLSQAEARAAAWMANDRLAMQQYAEGVDRYRFFAAHMFHDGDMERVTKTERNVIGKEGILSCQYKVGWTTVQNRVNMLADLTGYTIDAKTAKRMVGLFVELYPGYPRWWREVEEAVNENGFLVNPFGRKRIFFGRTDTEAAREALSREAVAYLPQSTIADLLNWRLAVIFEEHDPQDLHLLLQVHDAIVFEFEPSRHAEVARIVKEKLEVPIEIDGRTLVVPAEVSMSVESWAEMRRVA